MKSTSKPSVSTWAGLPPLPATPPAGPFSHKKHCGYFLALQDSEHPACDSNNVHGSLLFAQRRAVDERSATASRASASVAGRKADGRLVWISGRKDSQRGALSNSPTASRTGVRVYEVKWPGRTTRKKHVRASTQTCLVVCLVWESIMARIDQRGAYDPREAEMFSQTLF